jgi:hypothetical protein
MLMVEFIDTIFQLEEDNIRSSSCIDHDVLPNSPPILSPYDPNWIDSETVVADIPSSSYFSLNFNPIMDKLSPSNELGDISPVSQVNRITPVITPQRFVIWKSPPPTEPAPREETLLSCGSLNITVKENPRSPPESLPLNYSALSQINYSTSLAQPNLCGTMANKVLNPTFLSSGTENFNNTIMSDMPSVWTGKRLHSETTIATDKRNAKKRGVPHDRTPVDLFIQAAKVLNNYDITGLEDKTSYVIIHEDKFYNYVSTNLKEAKYNLKKTSFYEKFDKSRPSNRVNPKDKTGIIQIKYLRIDKMNKANCDFYDIIQKDMEIVEQKFGVMNIRVITRRDWNYLPVKYFVYEPKAKN